MKRLVSVGLLFLLVFQVAGYFAVFRLVQSGIRQEVYRDLKSGIDTESLVELLVPNDPAQARLDGFVLERNREIIFKGVYYDIVRSESAGSATRYLCYADHRESELVSEMKNESHSGARDHKGQIRLLISLAMASYLSEFKLVNTNLCPESEFEFCGYFFSVMTWDPSLAAPPPRLIA